MKISLLLADTGRPTAGNTLNLLNAGWSHTIGIPMQPTGFTVPSQCLALVVEAPWDQLNRPWPLKIELLDDEGTVAQLARDDQLVDAVIQAEITVQSTAGAPNGTPGVATFLAEFPAGALRIAATRHRYIWRVTIGPDEAEIGFWVNAAPSFEARVGGPNDPPSPTSW